MVLTGTDRELFVAIAGCAGALTGLLFVALSVSPQRTDGSAQHVIQQVRASAALLAFFNALAITLFGLVPGTNVGYPAVVLGVSGVLFTAAAMRSILASPRTRRYWRNQAGLVALLLVIFGAEFWNGIEALAHQHSNGPVEGISYSLCASLLVGVARAWELVGDRDTGILSSIAILTGKHNPLGALREPEESPVADGAAAHVSAAEPPARKAPAEPKAQDEPTGPVPGPRDGTD
jgi:hypothetical protein